MIVRAGNISFALDKVTSWVWQRPLPDLPPILAVHLGDDRLGFEQPDAAGVEILLIQYIGPVIGDARTGLVEPWYKHPTASEGK